MLRCGNIPKRFAVFLLEIFPDCKSMRGRDDLGKLVKMEIWKSVETHVMPLFHIRSVRLIPQMRGTAPRYSSDIAERRRGNLWNRLVFISVYFVAALTHLPNTVQLFNRHKSLPRT